MVMFVRKKAARFWAWYERYYVLNVGIAVVLFLWQLVHLYWLGADVIAQRLTETSFFPLNAFWRTLIVLVDYSEIPAIITTSLVYINELRKQFRWNPLILLLMLNSQWLHLFWITDEFVIHTFLGEPHGGTVLPVWLAWVAILIDYLELPVIFDIVRRLLRALRQGSGLEFIRKEMR